MEFLSALQEAFQMGFTKEEFIPIWKYEMYQSASKSQVGVPVHHVEELDIDERISIIQSVVDSIVREIQDLKHESFKLEEALSDLRQAAFNISAEAEETLSHSLQERVNSTQMRLHAFGTDVIRDTLRADLLKFEKSLKYDIGQLTGVCEAKQDIDQLTGMCETRQDIDQLTGMCEARQDIDQLTDMCETRQDLKHVTNHNDKQFNNLYDARVVIPNSTHPSETSTSLKLLTHASEAKVEKKDSTNPIARESNETEHVGDQGLTRSGTTNDKETISKRDHVVIQSDARTQEDEHETRDNLPAPNDTPLNDHQKWLLRDNKIKREFERFGYESSELSGAESCTPDDVHFVYYRGGVIETGNYFYKFSDSVFLKEIPIEIKLLSYFSYGKFTVSLWFKSLEFKFFKTAKRFQGHGKIENRSRGSYSELFTIHKGGFKRLTKNQTGQIDASVCLKTLTGSFDNVTFQTLEKRNFTLYDIMFIKWTIAFEDEKKKD